MRWRIFNKLHPINSRERVDDTAARIGALVLAALGAKNVREDDLNPNKFRPIEREEPPEPSPSSSKKSRTKKNRASDVSGLDPEVLSAFGVSDGRHR